MILVDTSIWIDHFRKLDSTLQELLDAGQVLCHPYVIGELSVGNLYDRTLTLRRLSELPMITGETHERVLKFIAHNSLFGTGLGYIDMHLLAAMRLAPEVSIWTRDRRMLKAAERLAVDHVRENN